EAAMRLFCYLRQQDKIFALEGNAPQIRYDPAQMTYIRPDSDVLSDLETQVKLLKTQRNEIKLKRVKKMLKEMSVALNSVIEVVNYMIKLIKQFIPEIAADLKPVQRLLFKA